LPKAPCSVDQPDPVLAQAILIIIWLDPSLLEAIADLIV